MHFIRPILFVLVILTLNVSAQTSDVPIPGQQWIQTYLDSVQPHTPLYLHAYCLQTHLDTSHAEKQEQAHTETYTWQFSKPAIALQAKLSNLQLQKQDTLKVYSNNKLLQYFTQEMLWQKQTVTTGGYAQLTIVLKKKRGSVANLHISELILTPENRIYKTEDFGDSQSCQVNVNCTEGLRYNNIVRSTVRIAVRLGSVEGWCSGTLLNNTANTFAPLILSAEHCGLIGTQFASAQDLNAWRFYFNYEAPDCANPANEGTLAQQLIGGASLLARSDDEGGKSGSDLLLLRLSIDIPEAFNVYYAGWNRSQTTIPANGTSVHHPEGDIKKISFMQGTAANSSYGGITPNTHWLTRWKASTNGQGTTEPGSSGAALFDENQLVVGQLTGGSSSCTNLQAADFYGKFSYNWVSNGSAPDRQLQPWLDPNNTGLLALPGANLNDAVNADTLSFTITPNPGDGLFHIKGLGSLTQSISITVFSANGQLVYNQETLGLPNIPIPVNLRHLRKGMYFFRIIQGEQMFRSTVLIEN